MLLRGAVVRCLRSVAVRPYSIAVDASGASAAANAAGSASPANREVSVDDTGDVTRQMSFREANKMRTRSRVKSQFNGFLKSRFGQADDAWAQGPPREAYWLLRACGSDMFLETTATRMELAHNMWEEFKKRAPLPVGMYNTLLQVYHQNSHRFDVTEFLEGMQKDGVLPNQGTLVGMLYCCCDEGDIDSATRILDQMRSLDMEITENIYAALINGHCRRGDMESANGMLVMMEENGMSPTATSYSALLYSHADIGDMESIEKLLDVMRERRVFPSMGVYTSVMDRLSISGHSDLLPRALDLVQNKQLIYNDLYELACKCTMRRDNKGTLTILRCMATLVPNSTNMHLGAILVRTMTTQGRSLPEVMVMVAELQSLGFGDNVYEEIVHSLHTREVCRDEAMGDALTVLQDMRRHDVVVKEHYFFPILAFHAENRDLDSAVRCVAVMKDMDIKFNRQAFRYLLQAAGEVGVASDSEGGVVTGNVNRLLDHIKGTPLSLSLVNEVCVYLLESGQFAQVPALLTSVTSESLVHGQLLKAVKSGVNRSVAVDVEGLVKVYAALHSLTNGPELARSFAITTAILVDVSSDLAKQFHDELNRNGIDPGEAAYHVLLHSIATPDTAKEFHTMVEKLQASGMVLRPSIHKHMLELAADMGDPVRAGQAVSAIRRSGERLSATAYSRYIVANAKSRRIGTALEIYERMRSQDVQPSYEAMNHLMLELLRWGDIHGAENMRRDLDEMGYSPGLIISNAFLGAYARRDMTKALAEFEALKASRNSINTFTYNEIMVGYSLHGDTDSIRKLFDELQREGLSLDRNLISRLFDAHLTKDDIDGALAVISEFPSLPPHVSSLVHALNQAVDHRDKADIERVREHVRKVYGDVKTANVMFFAYVRSDRIQEAEEILQNEGFSLDPRNLISFVIDMKQKRKIEEVCTALEMLKGKGHHLGDDTSVAVLRAYDILGDVSSAVALGKDLQAAGQTPTEEFTSRLSAMVQAHGHTAKTSQ